jgi:hypothetical protein
MKQILHIFAKDTRRFWPEIFISLAILAALVYVYPRQWTVYFAQWRDPNQVLQIKFQILSGILSALVPISWCVLIARVIQAEALVGDRQYWLTRPYDWKNLLGAKLLFLAVFLYLPLAVAQSLMLVAAGLNPLASMPGMLFNLVLITGIVVLPLVAIAAVTSSFFRMALALLAIVIGLGAYTIPASVRNIVNGSLQSVLFDIGRDLSPAHILRSSSQLPLALLLACLCGTAIALQYALRKTWLSRLILLGIPALLGCIILLTPNTALSDQARLERNFPPPAAGETAPIQFSSFPNAFSAASRWSKQSNMTSVYISLQVSGIADGTAVMVNNARITLEAPDGFKWSGTVWNWGTGPFGKFAPVTKRAYLNLDMPISTYARLQANPVTLRLTLPVTQLQATKVIRVPASAQDFVVPDFGVCGVAPGWGGKAIFRCRTAFREPPLTYASADWSDAPCSASQTPLENEGGFPWTGLPDSEPAEFGIGPVMFPDFGFGMGEERRENMKKHLCTGDTITLTQYKPVRRTLTTVSIADFHLPEQR